MAAVELMLVDLGNVLIDVDFKRFGRRMAALSGRDAAEVVAHLSTGPLKEALDRGQVGPSAFVAQVRRWLGLGPGDDEAIRAAWQDIFSPHPGAEAALSQLLGSRRVWLVSDTDPLHYIHVLNTFPWIRGFERRVLSFERGQLKRDPGAFEAMAEAAGVAGGEVLFVDDLPVNVACARAAGLGGVVFDGWESVLAQVA